MRKAFSNQKRFDCHTVVEVKLNLNCRDEIIPILRALQHIYSQPNLRDEILDLVAQDVNDDSRSDCGREGLDYWQILVLAAVRLGCNLDYDKLQDLAEQHRALRHIMGVGDWEQKETAFNFRRIHDNVCLCKPATIEIISHLIVSEGHRLEPEAPKKVRADSFVVETNIHYPTESSLIVDGVRKVIELGVLLSGTWGAGGWRQHEHLLKKIKQTARQISRIGTRKGPNYKKRLKKRYRLLLQRTEKILRRAKELCETVEIVAARDIRVIAQVAALEEFIQRTEHVCNTARRRVLEGERVPNEDKLFSIFETHTQLYKRGKAGQPIQFGRLVLIYEDAAGFIVHHHVMPRDMKDRDVVVAQTQQLQDRLNGQIEEASFDRGFHSPENHEQLAAIIKHPCLPKPGAKQSIEQETAATIQFHRSRRRHSGVESAIGAMQSGNGLERCRDATELGFERYVALGILGRNLHGLGKLLIAQEDELANASYTERAAA